MACFPINRLRRALLAAIALASYSFAQLPPMPPELSAAATSGFTAAQAFGTSNDAAVNGGIPPVRDMKLITATTGWVLAGQKIFWTETGGQNWREITPPLTSTQSLDSAYFADADHGWAVVHDPPINQTPQTVSVARTKDAGKTWIVQELSTDKWFRESAGDVSFFNFVDSDHGWLIIRKAGPDSTSFSDLFVTKDGGETWQFLPNPPVAGEIRFFRDSSGWLVGGVHHDVLYETKDGGDTWMQKVIPLPEGLHLYSIPEGEGRTYVFPPLYGVPHFRDENQGTIEVSVSIQEGGTKRLIYTTENGGKTWMLRSNSDDDGSFAAFSDSGIVHIKPDDNKLLIQGPGPETSSFPLPKRMFPKGFVVVKADLISPQNGWLLTRNGDLVELSTETGLNVLLRSSSPTPII